MSEEESQNADGQTPEDARPLQSQRPHRHESRFREMMRQSPFSTILFDPSGCALEVNHAFEQMWGVSAADVAGYNPFRDEQSHARGMIPFLERAFAGETVVMPEAPYDAAQTVSHGHRRWIKTFAYPLKDDAGRVTEVVFVHEDVTARRRAEELLRESESRYQRAAEAARVGVWDLNLETNDLYLSPNLKALLGYRDEELRNHLDEWCRIVHPDDKQKALSAAAAHVEGRTPRYEVEVRRRHKEGHYLWFIAQGAVIKDAAGKPLRLTGSDTDITERKQAEEKLRYQLHLNETITEKAGEALFLLNAQGRVTFMNPAAAEMFGWREEELLGQSLHDVIHYQRPDGTPFPKSVCPLGRVMSTGEGVRGYEDVFYARGGRAVLVRCSNAPVFEGDRITGAVLVASDITRRKRAEEERERLLRQEQAARAQAEEAGRLKDEFLATVSHELRTPLTAILGWAHLLEGDALNPETVRHAVAVIKRNAEQQRQLIEDILDVSRIITGKLNIETGRVEVAPIVLAAVETVQPAAEAKGVRLLTDLGPGAEVTGDPGRLQQVVWNLLANAVKFTQTGGEVRVKVARLSTHVRVEVSDTGQGISADFIPHVFDRFRQADGSTTRQHGGLGLGLSIVRHLVELHGGSVRAHSAGEGQGATFTVELPLPAANEDASGRSALASIEGAREAPGSTPLAEADYEAPPPLVGLRVLLVDDEADSLELLSLTLRRVGAEVAAAASAEEALEALAGARPDVIISDIGMPKMDGYELIRRVRSLGAEAGGLTPAIALTAYASEADRALALESGFQEHLAKPVEPPALVAAVVSLAARAGADPRG